MNLLFQSSMPRSGSELLQVLLHQNPNIYGSPTSPLLEYQFGARNNFELTEVQSQPLELMTDAFSSMCESMATGYYKPITDRPHIIDKNRGWSFYWDWVVQWYGDPKMVCMVRDLRDILCSMERKWRANRHRPTGPDNPSELQGMTFRSRCHHWLNTQPVGLALTRLQSSLERELPIQYLRYEDLVAEPQNTIEKWYAFTGIDSIQHTFDNITKTVEENSQMYGVYGDHTVKSKIVQPNETWRDMMSIELSEEIKQTNKWYFEVFQY